jgi:hypothetical protein
MNNWKQSLQAILWIVIIIVGALRYFGPIHSQGWPAAVSPNAPAPLRVLGEAVRVGDFLYIEGDWMNPFNTLPTGPTADIAPGFPTLVAAVDRAFGDKARGTYALEMTEATVLLAQIALIPVVMQALGTSLLTGLIASLIAVFSVRRVWTWEANYVGLLLLVATFLACRYYRATLDTGTRTGLLRSPAGIAVLLGGVWSAILLTGPSAGSVWLTWIVLGAWLSRRHGRPYAWIPALLVPVILLAPWEFRNYKVFHTIIPVRSPLGLELRVSNNPCAKVTLWETINMHCYPHPDSDIAEAQKFLAVGEVAYNRQEMREAVGWVRANPRQALVLWRKRFRLFWLPRPEDRIAAWTIDLATALSLVGLFVLARANRPGAVLCSVFLVVYPLVYYLSLALDRYRYPILWVTSGLAAVGCSALLQWAFQRKRFGELHAR